MKLWKKYLIALGVVLVLIQLVPLDRENPPVTQDIGAPPEVDAILRRSCYDCHSNEVRWPWYSYVAPVSYLVTQDVAAGRFMLNFSEWDTYDEDMRFSLVLDIYDFAESGEMPLDVYTSMHGDAVLSEAELEVLSDWVDVYDPADD